MYAVNNMKKQMISTLDLLVQLHAHDCMLDMTSLHTHISEKEYYLSNDVFFMHIKYSRHVEVLTLQLCLR